MKKIVLGIGLGLIFISVVGIKMNSISDRDKKLIEFTFDFRDVEYISGDEVDEQTKEFLLAYKEKIYFEICKKDEFMKVDDIILLDAKGESLRECSLYKAQDDNEYIFEIDGLYLKAKYCEENEL